VAPTAAPTIESTSTQVPIASASVTAPFLGR
jgi:hypothetical protein